MGRRIGLVLRLLSSVARAAAAALLDTCGVEATADDRVLDTNVPHATTAKHHDGVLLEVVTLTRDVGGNLHTVREAHASDLADSRVRLARGLRGDLRAYAALERRRVEGWAVLEVVETTAERDDLRLPRLVLTLPLRKLVDSSHL